jgi:hypothetical protein
VKKPALPEPTIPGFAESVRTWLQIICGRRNNRVTVPEPLTLTVSNPPTQAEVRALLAHVNRVTVSLHALVNRLDQ